MFTLLLDQPFYSGHSTSSEVPGVWPVGLNGRGYLVNTDPQLAENYRFRVKPLPLIRDSTDTSTAPSEQSISFKQFWKRPIASWHLGAGQSYFDREMPGRANTFGSADDSSPFRFNTSKGIDPWTKWGITLLHDTAASLASANTNVSAVTCGAWVYVIDGQTVRRSNDLVTWTPLTGTPAAAATGIATDGRNVWVSFAATGIYSTDTSVTAMSSYVTGNVVMLAYVNGRLIAAASAGQLYNITAGGTLGTGVYATALLDLSSKGWTWTAATSGQRSLYVAGYAGDKSLIYKTDLPADGTALTVPVVAAPLPDGEICYALEGYLGYVAVGTSKGAHLAEPDGNGYLTLGGVIPTPLPVRCFESQDRFIWFGWSNYDTVSTGLGRLDLQNFTRAGALVPAYASDLMCPQQGEVLSVLTFGTRRVFTVAGKGVYAEAATFVASGQVTSGMVTYGLGDDKVAVAVDVKHAALPTSASVTVEMSANGAAYETLGVSAAAGATKATVSARQVQAETFEVRVTLTNGVSPPTVTRVIPRAFPTPAQRPLMFVVPVLLASLLEPVPGVLRGVHVTDEILLIADLLKTQQIVSFQYGTRVYQVLVNDFDEIPARMPVGGRDVEGVMLVLELYEIIL